MKKGKKNITLDFQKLMSNAKALKNNQELSDNSTIALILEKICNEDIITNEFLESITIEDIEMAQEEVSDESDLIEELQKNTFLTTLIDKAKCTKTQDTEDFF
ncbi:MULTISPECIES: hypothetical protein [Clostridium]|jgi:predicted unusual protein kinase regulating ubiquinone biosynthesis (AarF/ABC1/UbiB family)|uniref:hypothetical protein n=1 Tax=Clostridium TaxID=1485 RepID=UPI000E87189D|nr:hypothetical protein [Clostridium tyrobutyricum]HBF76915.1 hypothetical protein [Clostridiaceae bacterium]